MKVQPPRRPLKWLVFSVLGLVTFLLYLPAVWHDFVDYDDQQYVTDNPLVQAGLTRHGFIWAFGFHAGNWHPLAWLSHMLDCQIYGAWAGGHHLTSILLHVGSTLLLFSLLNRMTGFVWRGAAVAALFAWHPLHVESVAWVAERKDVLCAFFWMLTLWLYTRYAAKPAIGRYLGTLGAFALCLMSKPMAVTLPFVLFLLDYWPLNRITSLASRPPAASSVRIAQTTFAQTACGRLILEKIPFLILSAIACKLTLSAQELAIVSTAGLPVSERLAHALAAYIHYFISLFLPLKLAVYYPYQTHLPVAALAAAGLAFVFFTVLALKNFHSRPYLLVGWLWFLGTLVPVIGLVQVGDQAWADRYTYLPLIGLCLPLVWYTCEALKNPRLLQAVAAIASVILLTLTSLQLTYWKNTRTLFEHANQVTTRNFMAVTVLGSLLAKAGQYDEAMQYYRTALEYQPDFPEAHFFLGNALDQQGKLDGAIAEYQKALWFRPTQEQTHIFLAIALAKQQKFDEAITHYHAALQLNPDSAVAHNNLARLFHTLGRFNEAIQHYQAALVIDPKLAIAHNNLGILLLQNGDLTGGISHLREALRLKPGNAETQFNLATALVQQGQWTEAANLFVETMADHKNDPKAHYSYGRALENLKQTRDAMSQYATAILLQPENADALNRLAWILSTDNDATIRNGTQAVAIAEQACTLTAHQDPEKLETLAAAYAETGRFDDAIKTLQTAKDLATRANNVELINECSPMLDHFQHGQTWRGFQ